MKVMSVCMGGWVCVCVCPNDVEQNSAVCVGMVDDIDGPFEA